MKKLLILTTALLIQSSLKAQDNFVSDFHKSHGGQIVYNEEAIPNEKTAFQFITEFDSKDDITAYVYMPKVIQSYDIYDKSAPDKPMPGIERKYFFRYFIDEVDQEIKGTGSALTGKTEGVTAFTIKILRKTGNVSHNDFRNKILQLKGGKHKIRIEMWGGNGRDNSTKEPIAKGEFTLDKIEYIEKSIGSYNSLIAAMTNPVLEKQAQKLVNEQTVNSGSKYSKPKIADKDWTVVKDEVTTRPICRTIRIIFYEVNSKGTCRAVYFNFKQNYVAAGKYDSQMIYNGVGVSDRVDCE